MEIRLSSNKLAYLAGIWARIGEKAVLAFASVLSVSAIVFSYLNDYIVRYGDSESHLNIAKRVVDSVTPGFAQLGGIWLPLPHMLMLPFIWSDALWRTGLAGAFVSGAAYVISAVFIYKTVKLVISGNTPALLATAIFLFNPNILYLQSTPMTEMVLISFFILSTYYFIRFMVGNGSTGSLLAAAFFGFCAVLSRYDGWFLVGMEAGVLGLYYLTQGPFPWKPSAIREFFKSDRYRKMEGSVVMFCTLAFFGIAIWLAWDFLILGDPFYFTHSEFSAASQQQVWLAKGELPAYHNPGLSFLYYATTAMANVGVMVFFPAVVGLVMYLSNKGNNHRWLVGLLLGVPFIFNVLTLFLGQSVIFIPHLTPPDWDHVLFNVRYGVMSLPLVAFAFAYLFHVSKPYGKTILVGFLFVQAAMYGVGYSKVISYEDGRTGLSSALRPEAERWINQNYDYGMVLMDDYARTVSVVRSGIPMEEMIYIGNKPYWEESLVTPDKHVEWIVMQENDAVWNSLWEIPFRKSRLEKYYQVVYESEVPHIMIFQKKRLASVGAGEFRSAQTFWNFQCLDTMKYSRDASRELITRQDLDQFLEQEMTLIQQSGATCVSLGTPYDVEFVPILTAWVKKAREKNLNVWFRGNMSGWEGWFDYPVFTDPDDHNRGTYDLITKHPELFQEGDIFTPIPEPENGMLGDPRFSAENREKFLEFLPQSYENCLNAFREIKIGVTCGYYSVNADVAREVFTKDFLVKIGDVAVIDHYVRNPDRLVADIRELNKKLDTQVVLGEFGAPIPDIHGNMTESQQADFINQSLEKLYQEQDLVKGLNYWTFRGGSTSIVNEGTDTREGYDVLKRYFLPAQVIGRVVDTLGSPVEGVMVRTEGRDREVSTNSNGEYSLVVPANPTKLIISSPGWAGELETTLAPVSGENPPHDFLVEPVDKGIWYKFRLWLRK